MPIYAYRCESCGHSQDVMQKLADAPLAVCPQCGADAFRKQLTAPAFQLKGTGWYVTDFRDNGKPKAKPDEAGDAGSKKPGDDAGAAAGAGTAANGDGAVKSDSAGKGEGGKGEGGKAGGAKVESTTAASSSGATPSRAADSPAKSAASTRSD